MKGLGGDLSSLIEGPVSEAPQELVVAVNTALSVIAWHENLPEDEQPPRHIWWSEKLTDAWFEGVRERRKDKHGGSGSKRRTSYEEADDVPMTENELIAQYKPNG